MGTLHTAENANIAKNAQDHQIFWANFPSDIRPLYDTNFELFKLIIHLIVL